MIRVWPGLFVGQRVWYPLIEMPSLYAEGDIIDYVPHSSVFRACLSQPPAIEECDMFGGSVPAFLLNVGNQSRVFCRYQKPLSVVNILPLFLPFDAIYCTNFNILSSDGLLMCQSNRMGQIRYPRRPSNIRPGIRESGEMGQGHMNSGVDRDKI